MLSPPVRRRCCVLRSRRRCTALRCRLCTRKPLGSCGFRARCARRQSIVATYTRPGPARSDRKPCAANARRADPNRFGGCHGSDRVSERRARRAARRCRAHFGSSQARRGLRCRSCRSAARCRWWPFRPSPCVGRSHAPSASRLPASCELAGWSRVRRERADAAGPSTAWPRRRSGQGVPAKKLCIAWAKSRSACCCTVCDPAASQSCSARAAVNCAHCSL